MSQGFTNGIASFPHQVSSGGAPAPPFAANSAYNGLSVDPVTGQIVLGNDIGDPGLPALLVSNREIPLAGNDLHFNQSIADGEIPNQGNVIVNLLFGPPGGSYSFIVRGVRSDLVSDGLEMIVSKHGMVITDDVFGAPYNVLSADNILLSTDSAIQTGDPGSGVAPWKLGGVIPGAVALDAANYVEVNINGAVVKLAIVV